MGSGVTLVELLVRGGLASSRSDARRLISQGGAYVNGRQWTDMDRPVAAADVSDGQLIVRAGKKRHHRFVIGSGS